MNKKEGRNLIPDHISGIYQQIWEVLTEARSSALKASAYQRPSAAG